MAVGTLAGGSAPHFVIALGGAVLLADLVWYSLGLRFGARALRVPCRVLPRTAPWFGRAEDLPCAHDVGSRFGLGSSWTLPQFWHLHCSDGGRSLLRLRAAGVCRTSARHPLRRP